MLFKSSLLFIAAFLFTAPAWGQSYGFVSANIVNLKNLSPGDRDFLIDYSGDLVLSGTFSDTMDIDPGPTFTSYRPAGNSDVFIQKQNAAGALVWHYTFGSTSSEVLRRTAIDRNNNIYILGQFQNTVDFDASAGVSQLTANSGFYANYLLKISAQGQFIWVRKLGENAYAKDLTVDSKGGVYVCGSYENTVDFDPGSAAFNITSPKLSSFFIQKLDTNGNFKWAKSLNNSTLNAVSQTANYLRVSADSAGNPSLCGIFYETVDFDPGSSTANVTAGSGATAYQMFVAKLDSLGNYRWAKRYSKAIPLDFKTDRASNMIVTGDYDAVNDFDPGAAQVTLSKLGGGSDIFLLKIDTGGSYLWATALTSSNRDLGTSLDIDSGNNIYLTGYSELNISNPSDMDFDRGAGTYSLPSISSSGVTYLHTVNPQGQFRSLTYLPSGSSIYRNAAVKDSNSLFILTHVWDSLDCNHGTGVFKVRERWFGAGFDAGYSVIRLGACRGAATFSNVTDTACAEYRSASGRYTWTSSGTYRDTIPNANGCDSVLTYSLLIYPRAFDTISVQSCGPYRSPSSRYTWTASGSFQDTLQASNGCDSVLTVNLTVNGQTFSTISEYACLSYRSPSTRHVWNASGIYKDTVANRFGCDSIITVNLTIHDTSVSTVPGGLAANSNVGTFQWLDCSNGFSPIAGATSEFYYPTASGSYAVIVAYNGCSDTSGCHEFWPVRVPQIESEEFIHTSPNPVSNMLLIEFPNVVEVVKIEIVDVSGAVILADEFHSISRTTINVATLRPGLYTLKIRARSWMKSQKITKS